MMTKMMKILSFLIFCSGWVSGQNPAKEITRIIKHSGYSDSTAAYWVKVAKLETGNFTSDRFVYNNNPWGMKYARVRKKTCMRRAPSGFATYCTKNDGYWDIILYMKEREYPKHFNSLKEFTLFLKHKYYFEEPFDFYYNALKAIK